MSEPQPMVRCLFRAIASPLAGAPTLSARTYYPALYSGELQQRNTGLLPAARDRAPYPVAILMPGINVSPDAYGWLAMALVNAGFVAMTYGWIVEEMPGLPALSPGLDIGALAPDVYGSRPSATALSAVIEDLATQNLTGTLTDCLDLDRILLGRHSAGGSVALFNARPDWFPGLRAVFSYGSHCKASTMLGYPPETYLPLSDALPTLMLGGDRDGVIAASAFRYGGGNTDGDDVPDPVGPLQRSFDDALTRTAGDSHLAIIRGANHFSASWPEDPSTGRPFLDWATTRDDSEIHDDIAGLVSDFARARVLDDPRADTRLRQRLSDPARIGHHATR